MKKANPLQTINRWVPSCFHVGFRRCDVWYIPTNCRNSRIALRWSFHALRAYSWTSCFCLPNWLPESEWQWWQVAEGPEQQVQEGFQSDG